MYIHAAEGEQHCYRHELLFENLMNFSGASYAPRLLFIINNVLRTCS